MNWLVLVAGWPFAGLLALSARRLDADSSLTCRSGIVLENDGRRGSLVLEAEDATGLIEIGEGMTALFGVDGYPISLAEIRVGDFVEAIQEKRGPEMVTMEIRVKSLLSSPRDERHLGSSEGGSALLPKPPRGTDCAGEAGARSGTFLVAWV